MCDFYGLNCSLLGTFNNYKIEITKSCNFEKRRNSWLVPKNHNHLRITRIIHCLKIMGLKDFAQAFFDGIMNIVAENPDIINKTTLDYWKEAMECEEKFFEIPSVINNLFDKLV